MTTSHRRPAGTLAMGAGALLLTLALIAFSDTGYHAALSALQLFLRVVLPSLLPFFILSDVLLALGVVHFLGECFEPLMRPFFNVPGVGSFVFSMGLAAGYPMDAVLTAKLRRQGMCTREEGERLLAFTNTADPMFLMGAVAAAMFRDPGLGWCLALGHYLSGLSVGLLFRFHGAGAPSAPYARWEPREPLWRRAVHRALKARAEDGRSLVEVLNASIADSARTLTTIAAFMMLFSVILRVLGRAGVLGLLTTPVSWILHLVGFPATLSHGTVAGLFEIDLGSAALAQAHAPLLSRLAMVGAVVAWSGLSVHAQVLSVLSGTDLRMGPYYVARLLHAVLAGLYTYLLAGPLRLVEALPAWAPATLSPLPPAPWAGGELLVGGALLAFLMVAALGMVGVHGWRWPRVVAWRTRMPHR